jgi:hypothetical protein
MIVCSFGHHLAALVGIGDRQRLVSSASNSALAKAVSFQATPDL